MILFVYRINSLISYIYYIISYYFNPSVYSFVRMFSVPFPIGKTIPLITTRKLNSVVILAPPLEKNDTGPTSSCRKDLDLAFARAFVLKNPAHFKFFLKHNGLQDA